MTTRVGYCPACNSKRGLDIRTVKQTVPVRGEPVTIETKVAYCRTCGGEVPVKQLDFATLERAYAEYRRLRGVPTADDIASLRKRYGLGQRTLAKLLGWSPSTVYRYEKGAIPVPAHVETIRRLLDPKEVVNLLKTHADRLTARELSRVKKIANSGVENREKAWALGVMEKWETVIPVGSQTGFRRFDFEKLLNMIVFFTRSTMSKTALMKHLWYADFLHFKEHGVSISGARYAALPHGPALEGWFLCLQAAMETGAISVESKVIENWEADLVKAETAVDASVFTRDEMETMNEVASRLCGLSAEVLRNMSHNESAWKDTPKSRVIPYERAADLQWPPDL
ncbi:MAG: DUF4065 domain-containing protein [Firmicutes bacterium]|nr:DUF4065 domain-containing protein [Bacillota bacterium]